MTRQFETQSCTRCGGGGQYSYCEMYGSTCFQCHGKGKTLTKRGRAAVAFWRSLRSIPASEVKIGQRIKSGGLTITVREITTGGSCRSTVNGVTTESQYTNFRGQKATLGLFPDSIVEVIPATEAIRDAQLNAAFDYQDTLTKQGKPSARKAA